MPPQSQDPAGGAESKDISSANAPQRNGFSVHQTNQPAHHTRIEELEEDLEDTPLRVLGYFGRLGRVFGAAMAKGTRYVAYSSDVGESLRPVVDVRYVRAGYAVALGYIVVDVGLHAKDAQDKGEDVMRTVAHQTTFQMLASLIIPSVIIHQAVHASQKQFARIGRFTRWGPVGVGLALIPLMPVCIDEPVEIGIEYLFDKYWPVDNSKHKAE